jgi:hypothetical protein
MEGSLLPECAQGKEQAGPQRKLRKRNSDSDDGSSISKRKAAEKYRPLPVYQKPLAVVTKNFFAPLRAVTMQGAEVCDETSFLDNNLEKSRPSHIVLTSEVNFLSLQKDLKAVVTREFLKEYCIRYPDHNQKYVRLQNHIELFKSGRFPILYFLHQRRQTGKSCYRHLPNKT